MKKKNENKDLVTKSFGKKLLNVTQNGLQKFSNHIWVKSLVSGFVSAMPIIIVSSIFMLMTAIPGIFVANINKNFQNFISRIYMFTFGIMGMVVTGQIAKALSSELNQKLRFDRKIGGTSVMVAAMCSYFLMSVITGDNNGSTTINVGELGAKGVLPGMFIGIITPYIFFFANKYNITIRLPKAVPQVISQSFLVIVPWFFTILLWGGIGYLFIYLLGKPFTPWFFEILAESLFKDEVASSYGMIVSYRFLETLSWFIGVHPEAIQGIFENIMNVNMESNAAGLTNHAFVESLMGPAGNMGGTGSTFVLPILFILFAKSDTLKVAGKTSVIPVSFQVNEPILFGAPVILNPIFLVPFMAGPMITSSLAKVFVDNFGLQAAMVNVPWATPWFIRGPIAQLGQWQIFLLLVICFLILFLLWLPFVLLQDRVNLKIEGQNANNKLIKINGVQFLMQKIFSFDFEANHIFKKFKINEKHILKEEIAKDESLRKKLTIEYKQKLVFKRLEVDKIRIKNILEYNYEKMQFKIDRLTTSFKEKLIQFNEATNRPKTTRDSYYKVEKKILILRLNFKILKMKLSNKDTSEKILRKIKNEELSKIIEISNRIKTKNEELLGKGINPYKEMNLILSDESYNKNVLPKNNGKCKKILVLCIGAGTSAMLANAINGGANNKGDYNVVAQALSYTNYKEALFEIDLIIISPQLSSYLESIEADAREYNLKVIPTRGKQYIDLCNDKNKAYEFAKINLE